ncbi:MAG: hypothetical protein DWQ37_17345 [Planctomycetota bacterium]|nr:MAG: hypothetical protein DWQ37_17345 [Planctomycetota bacterium]
MESKPNKPKKTPCPKCGSPLRLRPQQRGTQVSCPKCQATFTVGGAQDKAPAPKKKKPKQQPQRANVPYESPLKEEDLIEEHEEPSTEEVGVTYEAPAEDDAYEPEIRLERVWAVPDDEMASIGPLAGRESAYEVDWATTDDLEMEAPTQRAPVREDLLLDSARQRGLLREYHVPDPPKWTFFSGVFTHPWQGVNVTRWTAMSMGLSLTGVMAYCAVTWLSGGTSQALGVLMTMFTILMALVTLSFATSSCQAVIQDTADGHDMPQEASLPEWDQWIWTLFCWGSLWAVSGALAYPLALLIGGIAFLVVPGILFPILLLSAMEADSYLLPYSPVVLRTLVSYAHGWLTFYLLSAAMFIGWQAMLVFGFASAPMLGAFISGPIVAAIMLIYARLLGRVAWRASGANMAASEREAGAAPASSGKAQPAAAPKPNKSKKRRKHRKIHIELPDEEPPADNSSSHERPRISFHHRP